MAVCYSGVSDSLPMRKYNYGSNDKVCAVEHSICGPWTDEERYDSQCQETPPNSHTHPFTINGVDVSVLRNGENRMRSVYFSRPPEIRPDDMKSTNSRKGATFIKL